MRTLPALAVDLPRLLVAAQRTHRLPSVVAAVARHGTPVWDGQVGHADTDARTPATADTQYRIGSVTKTLTAALVLLLAHDGRLDPDDRLEQHLPDLPHPHGRATLRALLAHTSGLQREPPTPMWRTFHGPGPDELLARLPEAEQLTAPGQRWHYSNLAYALLGQVVEQHTGTPWDQALHRRLLTPLGMTRTTLQATAPAARGYRVDPYQPVTRPEPDMQQAAAGPSGQTWSTTADLLTWAHALAGGHPDVLPTQVVDAMHTLHAMTDPDGWTRGWGLGLILERHQDRILAGHTGAVPGFLAALTLHRPTGLATVVLTNASKGVPVGRLAADLLTRTLDVLPPEIPDPWEPEPPCPPELQGVLGRWWCEAEETVFTWEHGQLHAHLAAAPGTSRSRFRREAPDRYRVQQGREYGEVLHVLRDADGTVTGLHWATYPYTRHLS